LEGKVVHSWPLTTAAVWRSGGGLNEGTYLLHVQARDSDGIESNEFTFAFTIDPPWYRTLWAETVSGLLVILAFYLFNRWRTWQMKIRERELIQTVNLRTRELLGGQITIASELGQGSTFSFGIPRRNADPVKPELPLPQIVGYEGRRRRILVVDDEPLNRSMIEEELFDIVGCHLSLKWVDAAVNKSAVTTIRP
jgi:CheY-like chemotaxis protein